MQSVNGIQLTRATQALAACQRLRSVDQLTFKRLRRGKRVEIQIAIQ